MFAENSTVCHLCCNWQTKASAPPSLAIYDLFSLLHVFNFSCSLREYKDKLYLNIIILFILKPSLLILSLVQGWNMYLSSPYANEHLNTVGNCSKNVKNNNWVFKQLSFLETANQSVARVHLSPSTTLDRSITIVAVLSMKLNSFLLLSSR